MEEVNKFLKGKIKENIKQVDFNQLSSEAEREQKTS